jgi:CheY-like chemotaxis protein
VLERREARVAEAQCSAEGFDGARALSDHRPFGDHATVRSCDHCRVTILSARSARARNADELVTELQRRSCVVSSIREPRAAFCNAAQCPPCFGPRASCSRRFVFFTPRRGSRIISTMTTGVRGSGIFAISKACRVLIVDAHVPSAELIAEVLAAQGHHTQVAHDAASAERAALEFEPQVAILDIGLPGMSGYDLLQRLRARAKLAQCRYIALTGHLERADRRRSEQAGFETHLTKPLDLRAVLSAVAGDASSSRSSASR